MDVDRFVLEVGGSPPLDRDGFLELPSADAWWIAADGRPTPVEESVGASDSYALLAVAGAGKSTVLRGLREDETAAEIDLRTLDEGGIAEAMASAIADGLPTYLDAIDEAALLVPSLFRILEQWLSVPAAARTPWRLACRPAAWNQQFAQVLKVNLPGFREMQLLPLTREATRRLIGERGFDPDAFVEALTNAHLGRLSGTPGRLLAAAEQWHSTGSLPANVVAAMEFEVGQLLQEPDGMRPQPVLGLDQRRRVAERLGGMSIFGGIARFTPTDTADSGTASIATLPSRAEPDDPGAVLGPAEYRGVLGTAVFGPAGGGSVAFRHQQYAEYLAASYLITRHVGSESMRALLGVSEEGLLPGAMAGVTSWLLALDRRSIADLIPANALGFARTGLEFPDEGARAVVTEALLARARTGELDPDWSLELESLAHDGLSEQLRTSLEGGVLCSEHLWWVARLAAAGSCGRVADELIGPALDGRWATWARGAAINAIRALGDAGLRSALSPLLRLDEHEDPDDEVLADAIEALYPNLLDTDGLLATLRPRRNAHLIGGYFMVLRRLPALVPTDDLPSALMWLVDRVDGGHDEFGSLAEELIRRGWEESTDAPVLGALARVLGQIARTDARFEFRRNTPPPWRDVEPMRRRSLSVAVSAELNADDGWWSLFELGLVQADDAMWLILELPHMPEPARPALAACLPQLVGEPTLDLADRIFNLPATHPAYEATQWLRIPVALDSEIARRWQRIHLEDRAEAQADLEPGRQQQLLSEALEAAQHDPSEWWKVLYWLSVDEQRLGEALFDHDICQRPGWALLTESDQRRVFELGLDYARTHVVQPENWRGTSQIRDLTAISDWGPVYLLTSLAKHEPKRLVELDQAAWGRLAPAIVGAWNFDRHDDAELRANVVQLAPPEARASLIEAALADLDANADGDRGVSQRPVYSELMSDIGPAVADRLAQGRYSDRQASDLLDIMADRSPNTAVATARRLLAEGRAHEQASRIIGRLDAPAVIDELVEPTNTRRGRLLAMVPEINLRELDPDRLSRLARMLLDEFPIDGDPPVPVGVYSPDAGNRTRDARDSALAMLADRGASAALETLAVGRTGADLRVLTRLLRRSRARAVDLAVQPVTPDQLIALLERSDLRLVRSDRDLLNVVVEHLARLQDEITHGAYRDLWDDPHGSAPRPKREDDISDWVQRQLRLTMIGAILDREVQVDRPSAGGIGTRIDLTATAHGGQLSMAMTRVGVEAKLIDHPELLSAMTSQLVERYLAVMHREHGVYLVYWVTPAQRPDSWRHGLSDDIIDLKAELDRQSTALLQEFQIRPIVLNISRP